MIGFYYFFYLHGIYTNENCSRNSFFFFKRRNRLIMDTCKYWFFFSFIWVIWRRIEIFSLEYLIASQMLNMKTKTKRSQKQNELTMKTVFFFILILKKSSKQLLRTYYTNGNRPHPLPKNYNFTLSNDLLLTLVARRNFKNRFFFHIKNTNSSH